MSEDPKKAQKQALNALIVNWVTANNWMNVKVGKNPPSLSVTGTVDKKRADFKAKAESLASTLGINGFECNKDNEYVLAVWGRYTLTKYNQGDYSDSFPIGFVGSDTGLYVPPKRARSASFGDYMDMDDMDAYSFMDYPQHNHHHYNHHIDHVYNQQPVSYLHDGAGTGSNSDYSLMLALVPGLLIGLCLLMICSCVIAGFCGYAASNYGLKKGGRNSNYKRVSRSDNDEI